MKKLRRFVWFIAKRLMLITVILGLMTIAFYFSMNAANIFVILKDGMAQRALTVMMDLTIAVASGQPSKSEAQGVGEAEFVPWHLGETL